MSERYRGGIITPIPATPTTSSASGVWTLDQASFWKSQGAWPIGYTPAISTSFTASYLVVAGGGSGGAAICLRGGGGGGAGGMLTGATTLSKGVTYTVTVGAGGTAQTVDQVPGNNGTNSVFSGTGITTVTSIGGGGGGSQCAGKTGGSGGGGGGTCHSSGRPYGCGTLGQGNHGGLGNTCRGGGGGGGAGAVGANGTSVGGAGGNGLQSCITGSATYYAGGGGGGRTGSGGAGGGGNGGFYNCGYGFPGSVNTGGGGGGNGGGTCVSGAGGSGVVIISSSRTAAAVTGTYCGPTCVTGNKVYKFTGSGSITY